MQTKSTLVLRDIDILEKINRKSKAVVQMTLTTYDEKLCRIIEPNVATTKERFEALKKFRERNIPTVVWLSPFLPFINDNEENISGLLDYCAEADVKGIMCFGIGLTLRDGNREYFYRQLDRFFPGMKEKYIRLYGNSYEISSLDNLRLMNIIRERCRKQNIIFGINEVFAYLHKFESKEGFEQLTLF